MIDDLYDCEPYLLGVMKKDIKSNECTCREARKTVECTMLHKREKEWKAYIEARDKCPVHCKQAPAQAVAEICPKCGLEDYACTCEPPDRDDAKPVIDCGCTDCEWYDEGRGYEECRWCSRFSRQISRETSKSLITDRYKPKGVA